MIWEFSYRADPRAKELADKHYNRQNPNSPQFVPPGKCCVLYANTDSGKAFWVTSAPFGQYVKHRWPGAWVCSAFRNEGAGIASNMIIDALMASVYLLGVPPPLGLVTFIDTRFVKPVFVRGKKTFGRTYILAGFEQDGETQSGLLAFRLPEDRFPCGEAPHVSNSMRKIYDKTMSRHPGWPV
jgi:hypothetical protein